jgi:hypothetical protein
MAKDRQAMYDRFSDKGAHSAKWLDIVKNFLKLAFAGQHREAKCPCNRCRNRRMLSEYEMSSHIASLPFGSPLLRTPPVRPTTSTPPTVGQTNVKIDFIYLLDYFAFLAHPFICLSGGLRDTIRRQLGIQLHRCPLQPDSRIQQEQCGAVVLVLVSFIIVSILLSLVVDYIVLTYRTCFAFACRKLYCGFTAVYDYSYIFYLFWRLPISLVSRRL